MSNYMIKRIRSDLQKQVRSPKSKWKPLEHRFSPKWSKLVRLTRIPTNVWAPFPSSCLEFIDCRPPGCWSGSHSMPPGGKTRTKTREPDTIPTHCAATSSLILTSPLMFDLLSANGQRLLEHCPLSEIVSQLKRVDSIHEIESERIEATCVLWRCVVSL